MMTEDRVGLSFAWRPGCSESRILLVSLLTAISCSSHHELSMAYFRLTLILIPSHTIHDGLLPSLQTLLPGLDKDVDIPRATQRLEGDEDDLNFWSLMQRCQHEYLMVFRLMCQVIR